MTRAEVIAVRPKEQTDVAAAAVHAAAFVRQRQSEAWLTCNLRAFPRMMSFSGFPGS